MGARVRGGAELLIAEQRRGGLETEEELLEGD